MDLFNFDKPADIRQLTLKQPYASLMLHGKIETRLWNTNYRGKVLIIAGLSEYDNEELHRTAGDQYERIFKTLSSTSHHKGYAIAIGDLYKVFRMRKCDEEQAFVQYQPHLFCWFFRNVLPIQPFEIKGTLGLPLIDQDTRTKIKPL